MHSIGVVTTVRPGEAPLPEPDATSYSGYRFDQHRLVLPAAGTDGYHWVMQTERMLAGEGLRIRHTDVDNAPHGRAVHWSSPLRWWLGAVSVAQAALRPNVDLARSVERSAAWANTLLLALLLVLASPLVARAFGALPAALFAVAWVAVFPLYELFMVGILDHHGITAMTCFGGLLLLAGGGGGRIRTDATGGRGAGFTPWRTYARARRWFIAAGITSGIGMWLSAATLIPVIAATGAAAILAVAVAPHDRGAKPELVAEPALWRAWGAAGCVTSILAWLLEYAPAHLALRLEVNHPLYALAWLGGGELVARACSAIVAGTGHADRGDRGSTPGRRGRSRLPLAAAVLLLVLPLLTLLAGGRTVFHLADPFLRALHHEHIVEFQGLLTHIEGAGLMTLLVQGTTLLPIVLVLAAGLLSRRPLHATASGGAGVAPGLERRVRAATAGVLLVAGALFVHATLYAVVRELVALSGAYGAAPPVLHVATLPFSAAATAALFLPLARVSPPTLRPAEGALLLVPAVPAAVLLALSVGQVRWLSTAAAALLALLVTAAAVPGPRAAGQPQLRTRAGALLVLILLPFPLLSALVPWRSGYRGAADVPQLVARDVAYRLRAEHGAGEIVVAAPPGMTTWLAWFGGIRGVGTLYWENLDGLRATAALFAAVDEAAARRIVEERGVTHIVVPGWEGEPPRWLRAAAPPAWLERLPDPEPPSFEVRVPPVAVFAVRTDSGTLRQPALSGPTVRKPGENRNAQRSPAAVR